MLVNLANFLREQLESYYQDQDIVKSGDGNSGSYRPELTRSLRNNGGLSESGFNNNFDDRYNNRNAGGFEMDGYQQDERQYREARQTVGPNECRYCHEDGHRLTECPQRNAKLCFTCNQVNF